MTFFNIVPRDEGFFADMSNAVPLRVIMDNGVNMTPGVNINVTELSHGYDHFYNTSSDVDVFKIKIVIKQTDMVKNETLIDWLDRIIRNMTQLYVSTDAIDIKDDNKTFIITKNQSRTQTTHKQTIWELEFRTYNPVNVFKYDNNNAGVLEALKKAKQHKNTANKTKSASSVNAKFKKCNYKNLVYKKKNNCIKYLQEILYKNKCLNKKHITGKYDKNTVNGVKKFQKKYNTKQKVKNTYTKTAFKMQHKKVNPKQLKKLIQETGKFDKTTFQILCKS